MIVKSIALTMGVLVFGLPASASEPIELLRVASDAKVDSEGFERYDIDFSTDTFFQALLSGDGAFRVPGLGAENRHLKAAVSEIDTTTTAGRGAVYSGPVTEWNSDLVVGKFVYAHLDGSNPYIAVSDGPKGYEVFAKDATGKTGYLLKTQSKAQIDGPLGFNEDEIKEFFLTRVREKRVEPNGDGSEPIKGAASQKSFGCNVDLTVGYVSTPSLGP